MIDLIKRNGNQNTTSEVRRLLVFVNLIATNVESIGEVQTKDAEPERFKSVANKAKCDN